MAMPTSITDPLVQQFRTTFGLTEDPVVLGYQAAGYAPIQCHINAKVHAINNGGKRVLGWAVWQLPTEFIGEFHSVWENTDGTLIDVTPPRFGGQTMFIRDTEMDIYTTPGGEFVLQSDRVMTPSPHFRSPFGTADQVWGLNPTAPSFVAYCNSVGLSIADFATDPLHG